MKRCQNPINYYMDFLSTHTFSRKIQLIITWNFLSTRTVFTGEMRNSVVAFSCCFKLFQELRDRHTRRSNKYKIDVAVIYDLNLIHISYKVVLL